jgi:tetratricopeptide (TPR) repeat protein
MARRTAALNWIAWLLFVSNAVGVYLQKDPPRTVSVKIAVDNGLGSLIQWKARANSYLYECLSTFTEEFGIKLEINELGLWYPSQGARPLQEALGDLKSQVPPGRWDIVLGIISPERVIHSGCGISSFLYGYVLIQNLGSKSEIKAVLLHEFCHIFGAIDLREKGSIMSTVDPGPSVDNFTKQTVFLHKSRFFDRASFPLPQENLDKVITLYKERVELGLKEPESGLYLAWMYTEKGDCQAGLRICEEVATANPRLVGIHNFLGNSYFVCGRIDQAIAEYQQAIELQPDEPGIHYNLGRAYYKKGIPDAAETEYKKALQLNPVYIPAHLNLGHLYVVLGRLDAAISEWRATLQIDPKCAEVLCILGSAILLRGERTFKHTLAGSADEGDPDLIEVAETRPAESAIQEAINLCQNVIFLKPDMAEAHNTLGTALAYQKRYEEAAREFLKALEIKLDFLEAHYNMSLLSFKCGAVDKAIFHLKKILEINPASGLSLQVLARVFQAQDTHAIFAENIKE